MALTVEFIYLLIDSLEEDKLDLADIKPSVLSDHNNHVKKEVPNILENFDTAQVTQREKFH
ncbi:hypothetical protein K1T71_000762 [Dendrolimus kikuchii]|uniref:Uncharacterized protein n=1 Tax=Dendrolimus kikuchii TaxID=765133 RepID=A0ACC1DK31_9NEOP|nr:hypothetical protein K1T71_000762 [Dendrolimus kikuchii]